MNLDLTKKLVVISGGSSSAMDDMLDTYIKLTKPQVCYKIPTNRNTNAAWRDDLVYFLSEHDLNNESVVIGIAEPEMHLTALGQMLIAKFITNLVGCGQLRVIITTHSEIIIRQLNHLIYFNSDGEKDPQKWLEFCQRFGYDDNDLLNHKDVAVYIPADGNEIFTPIPIDETGFSIPMIESVLMQLNEEVYFFNDNVLIQDANDGTTD